MKSTITIILVDDKDRNLYEFGTRLEFTGDSNASTVCALAKNKLDGKTKYSLGEAKMFSEKTELKPTDIVKDFAGQYICKITKA
jgi:hypothetical protein